METTKPATKWNPWPTAIIALFIVFGAFIASYLVMAARQRVDLVSDNYYDDEVRFQDQLDKVNRARALGAPAAIVYDVGRETVEVSLPAEHAHRAVSGRIRFYRPSDSRLDQEIELGVDAAGVQRVDVRKLRAGLWNVRVEWTVDGKDFLFTQPLIVRAARS